MKTRISFTTSFLSGLLSFCLVCSLAFTASAQQVSLIDNIVAKVGNHIVLRSELEFQHSNAVTQGYQSPNLRCEILQSLIQNKLLLARAEMDSVLVDESVVTGELESRLGGFIAQIGSPERLEEYFKKPMAEIRGDLRRSIREQMTLQKMEREISGSVEVTPKEVRRYFNSIPNDSLPYFSTEVEVARL